MISLDSNNWKSFKRVIIIAERSDNIFNMWMSGNNITKWFLEEAKFYKNGEVLNPSSRFSLDCTYKWKWYGWDYIQEGKILEVVDGSLIKFTFGEAGVVTVRFEREDESRSRITLEQSDIKMESAENLYNYYYGCTMGWSFWLVNLKAFIEHGITLNDKKNPFEGKEKMLMGNM